MAGQAIGRAALNSRLASNASRACKMDAFFSEWSVSLSEIARIFLSTMSHILNGYLTAFFVASGVVLNIFSIFIFLRCERSGTPAIQYYLVTLTIWQTALLCNAFMLYCLPNLMYGHLVSNGSYVHIYPYVYTFANTTHTGSVWIVLTLTIDRYLALCQPLKHRAIGKRSRVRRLMVVVSIMAAVFSLPRFFEVQVSCDSTITDVCSPVIERTTLFDNKLYWSLYHVVLAMLFVTLCPCLLLCALTARISFELRAAIAQRKHLCRPNFELDSRSKKVANYSRKEHKSNIMLVLVIAKFLISDILPTVADVLEHIVGQDAFMSSAAATLFVDVSNFLLVLNCSSNFWVFFIWGKRFRRSCRQFVKSTRIANFLHMYSSEDATSVAIVSSTARNSTRILNADSKKYLRPGYSSRFTDYESTGLTITDPVAFAQDLHGCHKIDRDCPYELDALLRR